MNDDFGAFAILLGVGAIVGCAFWLVMHQGPKNYRLPGGEVVTCTGHSSKRRACALLYDCTDGRERCVTEYEVIP